MASVCRFLQCLISALTQAEGGSLLFRFACSVMLRRGRGTADQCHWPVWGALAVYWPQCICPRSRVCVFPVYTAQAPSCSIWSGPCIACSSSFPVFHKSADSVGPAFCAFPGLSSSGSQELDECTLPGCTAPYPLSGSSLSFHTRQLGACTLHLFLGAGL